VFAKSSMQQFAVDASAARACCMAAAEVMALALQLCKSTRKSAKAWGASDSAVATCSVYLNCTREAYL